MSSSNPLYYVQITEPISGKFRVFYLYDGISGNEFMDLYRASFECADSAIGFSDESGVVYPPSLVAIQPKLFGGKKLFIISDNVVQSSNRLAPTIGVDSEDTIVTEEQVRKAFQLLDLNSDNVVHKEEFIEAMTASYANLFEMDPGLAFAYSCIGSKDLAIVTAMTCYSTLDPQESYFLHFDDFCAWYMSAGFDPLRELMIPAIELQSNRSSPSEKTSHNLRRTKSRTNLDLSKCYSDAKLRAFVNQMRSNFELDISVLDRLVHSFLSAGKPSSLVTPTSVRGLLTNCMELKDECQLLLNILVDMNDADSTHFSSTGSLSLAQLLSLFVICSSESESISYQSLFRFYQENGSDSVVSDLILYNHLTQVFRLIFYFNREYLKVTGSTADNLAHAIYVKLLISVEIQRKSWGKLSFSEFIELFVHGLQLGLDILQVREGYFFDLLTRMLGYYPVILTSDKILPSDSVDGFESDSDILRADTNDLEEDDQVKSFLVGYNGASLTITEANELIGLHEYATYDVVKYVIQLCSKDGRISQSNFNRGILKLIGDHYITLSVLQRSIVDFILDRLTQLFSNSKQENNFNSSDNSFMATLEASQVSDKFSLIEVCISLLLFCDDDTYSRAEIILALLRPKSIKFSVVNSVASNLFKACYALNPSLSISKVEKEAEADAKALCMEFYMNEVALKTNPLKTLQASNNAESTGHNNENYQTLFTNTQFLRLINAIFARLEVESEKRKIASSVNIQESGQVSETASNANESSSLHAFSEDEESDGLHLYLDDDRFPPSSTVLELRAACSILGLEHYKADDLLDKLGGECQAGRLSAAGWSKWFSKVIRDADVSTFDVDIAIALGNKLYAAFQPENESTISYTDMAIGLAFLSCKSPLEERIMVAFTIADSDSDGFISFQEFLQIIRSALLVLSICSRHVTKKIVAIGASVEDLAYAAALEGIGALGIQETDELNLEMICDLAEDYLKLSSLV